ncbi:MAG: hypothetical protein WCI49_16320 [Ferruginibacter sp.]
MKKIQNTIAALISKMTRGENGAKSGMSNAVQLQPVYQQPTVSFMQAARKNKSASFIAGVLILLMVSVSFSSCFTSGYGCKGRSRCMTRVN